MATEPHSEDSKTTQPDSPRDVPLPDPTLISLAAGLATQAMVSMGIFPNPVTGEISFMLHQAKHLIETVAMIEEKTKGNRTEEESKTISNMLHELRMIFIAAQNEKRKREQETQTKSE